MLAIMGYFLLQVGPYGPFVYMRRIITRYDCKAGNVPNRKKL